MNLRAAAAVAGVLALVAAGAVPTWWWMDGRLEACRNQAAQLGAAVAQRDGTIETLREANTGLEQVIGRQNARVVELAQEAGRRHDAAAEALAAVRKGQDATRRVIASLEAGIRAGAGDCAAAVAKVRAGL